MRLLICAGGTGGGVYPALAVLQALKNEPEAVLWVGSEGGMEAELVKKAGIPFQAIPAAGVHGVGVRALPGNILRLLRGTIAARRVLREFKPDVLMLTGGYVAVPMAVAGFRIPSLLYVPDIEPGLALKFLSRFAAKIGVTTEDSIEYFSNQQKVCVTGYPVRDDYKKWDRETARAAFGLALDKPVLLVFGGSKGARSINRALMAILPQLLEDMQVVHISGKLDWEEVKQKRESLPENLLPRYKAYAYLHGEMGAALGCADLVVSRAGASVLGEYPLYGLPSILVPYPHAWRYQRVNAEYLVKQGGAVLLKDEDLPDQLLPMVKSLFQQPQKLQELRTNVSRLQKPAASENLAGLLCDLAGQNSGSGGRA